MLPQSLILVCSMLCLDLRDRRKRSQAGHTSSPAIILSKELVPLLNGLWKLRRCLLAERQKVGIPNKKSLRACSNSWVLWAKPGLASTDTPSQSSSICKALVSLLIRKHQSMTVKPALSSLLIEMLLSRFRYTSLINLCLFFELSVNFLNYR